MDRNTRASSRRQTTRARARYEAKKRHKDQTSHAVHASDITHHPSARREGTIQETVINGLADVVWYIRHNRMVWLGGAGLVLLVGLIYLLTVLFSGNIARGVTVAGFGGIGGLSNTQAVDRLLDIWHDQSTLELVIDAENSLTIKPQELGIRLNTADTVQNARDVGLSAFPFGKTIDPVLDIDFITAQNYLMSIANEINTAPSNATYEYVNGEVIGVMGAVGRRLDITNTLDYLTQNLITVIERGKFELFTTPLYADYNDPTPYLAQVQALTAQQFHIKGYDPITNQSFTWPVQPHTLVTWLNAGAGSLAINRQTFEHYLNRLNETLTEIEDAENQPRRYLFIDDAMDKINEAITTQQHEIDLRVRRDRFTYEVVRGDTASAIARKTGIPFYLIQRDNPNRNLDILSVGDQLNIPSTDEVMPFDPVPHKRIVVDLDRLYLTAFENGEVKFEWTISIGVRNAPTAPGVYQIISHAEKAYGSSNTLCNSAGVECGIWEMNWFMGIYQVMPGLENGFHGSVLLPNGGLLGDGAVGGRTTFGCVMSTDAQARMLYEWADAGTTVEIISGEYAPTSDLGNYARQRLISGSA
jgi:LysM repeat protein